MSKKDDALKLALEALEETLRTLDDENAKPGGAISDTIWYSEHETLFDYIAAQITAIRKALAEQPAQPAQQELKRIRSIISAVTGLEDDDEEYLRDAVKALDQLIEAQPAIKQDLTPEQPAQQEQGDSNCQDDDGCPTEMAVLQRFWRGEPIPTEHYPAWFRPAQQQEPVAWTATRLWNRKDTWTCPADIEKDLLDGCAPPASKPLTDEQREKLRDAFAQALTSVYVCGRVWEAWQYGTMSEGDFQPASECEEVLDALIEAAHGIGKGDA